MKTGNFNKKQVKAVAKTGLEKAVAKWLCDKADDYDGDPCGPMRDLFQDGCASGTVGGLCYYKGTCAFYAKHKEDIWTLAMDRAEDQGISVFEFLAQCNHQSLGDVNQVENFLAWFGFEEAARNIESALENLDDDGTSVGRVIQPR